MFRSSGSRALETVVERLCGTRARGSSDIPAMARANASCRLACSRRSRSAIQLTKVQNEGVKGSLSCSSRLAASSSAWHLWSCWLSLNRCWPLEFGTCQSLDIFRRTSSNIWCNDSPRCDSPAIYVCNVCAAALTVETALVLHSENNKAPEYSQQR
jgi:hypothetical protein